MDELKAVTLEGNKTTIGIDELNIFRDGLRGRVLVAGDPGYDEARLIWNALHDKRPAIIAQCLGAADVIDSVNFARNHNLLLAVKSGGHNVAGNAVCDDGLVIDLSKMNLVRVDEKARRAYVGGGALLSDVDRETQVFGLATPLGLVSLTGVAGLTLCGGIGYLRRKYGMSCDALKSVDIVTADGKLLKANEEENTDLFWAVRGGGGNFGVVVSFEFELYPVGPTVTLCAPFFPMDDSTVSIVKAWQKFMSTAPEEVTSNCLFWNIPVHPNFPEEIHGRAVVIPVIINIGEDLEAAEALIQPIRALGKPILDLSGPIPFTALQSAFDPMFVKAARQNYWKSLYLDTLDESGIETIVARAKNRPDPWSLIAIWHLGGAMNRVDPGKTALGERDANYLYSLDISWTNPAENEQAISWTRDAWAEMQDYSRGGAYLNFPGDGEEGERLLRASYGDDNYNRLVKIKRNYDPGNLFRLNQNIKP